VSDASTRLADALKTAGAFTFEKRGEETVTSGEIHLFSDGAAPDLAEVANRNLPVIYHRIGLGGQNAAITRLDARINPENPGQRAVFVGVANLSTNAWRTDIELLFDNQLVETRPLDLAPTNSDLVIFKSPQTKNGIFTVRLTAADDLAADNQASIVSVMPTPAKVLLVSKGNRFMEKAIKGSPGVQLTVSPQLTDPAEAFDLCVLDDVIPAVWPKGNVLAFRVVATNWFSHWEVAKNPPIVDWKTTHPVMRFVNFDNVQVAESIGVKPPGWGVVLVESPQTPLVVAGEINRRRMVWVGFDPLQSTWPLRISFPIFMANAIDWLNPGSADNNQLLVQAGNAFRWPLAQPAASAQVTTPDGKHLALPLDPGGREVVVNDTVKQGTYQVKAGTNEVSFCVNLLDSFESNITPREELPIGKYGTVAATTMKRANMELWRWIALAGLVVLLFEWWWYHKRTA
jgi:hypothetical protein